MPKPRHVTSRKEPILETFRGRQWGVITTSKSDVGAVDQLYTASTERLSDVRLLSGKIPGYTGTRNTGVSQG